MARNNVEISRAESARRFHKFALAHGQHLRAHQASVTNPSANRQRKNQVENSRTAKGHEGDSDENARKRKKRIHQHDVDEAVDASSVISGKAADNEAEQKRKRNNAAANKQRNSRAPNQPGENVASEFIGSAPMMRRWRLQPVREIDVRGILRRNPGREDGGKDEDGDQHDSDGGERIVARDAHASIQLPIAGCQLPVGCHLLPNPRVHRRVE